MSADTDQSARGERAKEVLGNILSHLEVEATMELREEDEHLLVNIDTSDYQMLIGKKGQTLEALQFLVNRMVGRTHPGNKRIIVDCANYRARRSEQLRKMALEVAEKVKRERIPYAFDSSLTPAERRIIHMELVDEEDVFTRSEGESDDRRLVVLPGSGDE